MAIKYTHEPEYSYINTYDPLPWQVEPWRDKSTTLLLVGSSGGGKALDVDLPILTTSGWKTMGTIRVEDTVFDEQGQPCLVTATSEVMFGRPCFEVVFSSGEHIIADAEHQWLTYTAKERRAWSENLHRAAVREGGKTNINANPDREYGRVRTTQEIASTLMTGKGANHAIRLAAPLEMPKGEPFLIPPYVLGAWLGDGHSKSGYLTCHDEDFDIIESVLSHGYDYGGRFGRYTHRIVGLGFELDEAGLLSNKHIPEEYFTACYDDRMALLQGLLDTDGHVNVHGRVEISQVRWGLINDIRRLLATLGIRANIIANRAGYTGYKDNGVGYWVECGTRYRISFYTNLPVFNLKRKLDRCVAETIDRTEWRYIKSITPVESVPVCCLQVDSPSSLFLVGDTLIPTHNSKFCSEKAHGFCLRYPGATVLMLRKIRATMSNSTLLFVARKVIGRDPRVVHKQKDFRFEYSNGSILAYGGMKDDEQREYIRSLGQDGGVDMCWMEEATQFDEEDYNEVLARMRGVAAGWTQIMLSTNPEGPDHWINHRLILKQEASVYYSSALDNPYLPDEYIDTLKNMTGVQYRRLALGEWCEGSGRAIDTWVDEYNAMTGKDNGGNVSESADYIPGGGEVIWTIDDGYSGKRDKASGLFSASSHPRAILLCQLRANGQIAVFHESYEVETLAVDHIGQVLGVCHAKGWPAPSKVVRDRAAASLEGALDYYRIRSRYNTQTVEEGVKELRTWVAKDSNGFRRLIVHPRCFYLRREFMSYSLDDAGRIIKAHDHGIDSCVPFETQVETDKGLKEMGSIRAGDRVKTRTGYKPVTAWGQTGVKPTFRLELDNGMSLEATPDHKIFTPGGLVRMDALRYNDCILTLKKKTGWMAKLALVSIAAKSLWSTSTLKHNVAPARVRRIYATGESKRVYDITVDEDHEFFANGILVSNCRYLVWDQSFGASSTVVDVATMADVMSMSIYELEEAY